MFFQHFIAEESTQPEEEEQSQISVEVDTGVIALSLDIFCILYSSTHSFKPIWGHN